MNQAANYVGCLGDLQLFGDIGCTWPTCQQIEESKEFWWSSEERLQCQLLIHCFATEDTVRGGLIIAEDATRVFAFVLAWAMALGFVKPRENQGEDDLESESLPSPTKTKLSQETSSRCFLFLSQS